MGGCLSGCLPLLRTLFPRNSLPQTPHSYPPSPAVSPSPPLPAALAHHSPLRSADEEHHQATFSETQLDRFLQGTTKREDLLPGLGAGKVFCSSNLGTENSNEELEAACLNKGELRSYLLESKGKKAELHGSKQSPLQDDDELRSCRKPDVSDPTSTLDSLVFAHEYSHPPRLDLFPRHPGPQRADTNQPWKQGDEVSDDLPSLVHYVPVSNLPDESYPCSLQWHEPPPPPSLPHPPSQLPQESPAEDVSFHSREIRPPVGLSHRFERKKAITAYGDTKSSSSSK